MKKTVCILLLVAQSAFGQVTVNWLTPTNGQTVSGIIPLTVQASSTMGRIVRVEYYRDGVLIKSADVPVTPKNLQVMRLLFHWNSRTNNVSNKLIRI